MVPETDSLYLSKLKFDPKLNNSFMNTWLKGVRFLFLLLFSLIFLGIFAYISLPRELNPEVEIPIVSVVTVLPGANPLDVEELITDKIESEISNITTLSTYTSSSTEGVSVISLEFTSTTNPDDALTEAKEKVDLVTDLPEDATTPRVTKLDFNDQPVWQVALVGETDQYSLTHIADQLQEKLEANSAIRRVDLGGQVVEELVVSLDQTALVEHGLTAATISQAIQAANVGVPAGSLKVNELAYQVSVDNTFETVDDIRQLQLASKQGQVRLGEIATVSLQAQDSDVEASFQRPEQPRKAAVDLNIYKTSTATIFGAVEAAEEIINQELANYPDVEAVSIINTSQDVEDSFSELNENLATTVVLVFLTLLIFLGVRQALIASVSIPLTFLSAFVVMWVFGISLNFLSLFSLLLALGLVVDDAIVIVQASFRYGQKFNPRQTGLMVFKDFVVPIWTTTITTVWAFVPLLLSTGIIGEFIKSIPIVVAATLLSSTTIAVFINLPLTVLFSDLKIPGRVKWLAGMSAILVFTVLLMQLVAGSTLPGYLTPLTLLSWIIVLVLAWISRKTWQKALATRVPVASAGRLSKYVDQGFIDFSPVSNFYSKILTKVVNNFVYRVVIYVSVAVFFGVGIVFQATGLLKTEFFPKTDQDQLFINFEGPAGWSLEKMRPFIAETESLALALPEVKHIFTKTGSPSIYTAGPGATGEEESANLANMTIVLKDESERDRGSIELAELLREQVAPFSSISINVEEQSGGPPAGADLQVNITGPDLVVLEEISNEFERVITSLEGAENVQSSLKEGSGQLAVKLQPQALQERGLSAIQVGSWLRTAITGTETGTISLANDDVDIVVRLSEERRTLDFLQNVKLPGQFGSYALTEIATLELETSPTAISHKDGERVVTVTAAASGVSATELLEEFEAALGEYQIPVGYTWNVGGVNEENEASVRSIISAMGLAAILILVTMVLQLGSFRKSFIVLAVIPLAVAGVFFNFTLFRIPLSFPALIGVLALFGIVVNNSIMLVEKINQNLKFGLSFVEGVVDACSSRVEAIFFTSLTTTIGLLPITISDPLWRGLGGAIIAGLSVSGLLILFLLPAIYVEVYGNSKEAGRSSKATA